MASHQDFVVEWTMLHEDSNNWTSEDLHLAAELGRSLLERNEELENEVKSHQILIDDQAQEIEFLSKQLGTMKEENLNRSKFYEQLETSLYDLERTNQQLVQKREFDKKRIMSMCENIEYLERKCEELSGTLDTIRESNKKRYQGKPYQQGNTTDYFSFTGSSDSSEEDVIYGGAFRKRAQSLQDLRDFTPSPYDEFDSNPSHSNSPDLKTSEKEFIQTLESRVEELLQAKKTENDTITQLESQLRLLAQENANLHQQLTHLGIEKQEEINLLRKELVQRSPSNTSTSDKSTVTITEFHNASTPVSPEAPRTHVCKRCAMEINVLNLVNSIEYENDDYSSLEFELARASESLSAESSSMSSIDSPVLSHGVQHPDSFEPGFLDYFFGTNSILKKIHLKRSATEDPLLPVPSPKRFSEDEDSSIAKDVGKEKYQRTGGMARRKLKLPDKIPDQDESLRSNFDENMICDAAEVSVGVEKRSKFWWVVWFTLLVLGSVQLLWQTTRLLFWFILTAILPRSCCVASSSSNSTKPIAIRPSSIFPNNDFKSSCAYFPSSRLHAKIPSASYA